MGAPQTELAPEDYQARLTCKDGQLEVALFLAQEARLFKSLFSASDLVQAGFHPQLTVAQCHKFLTFVLQRDCPEGVRSSVYYHDDNVVWSITESLWYGSLQYQLKLPDIEMMNHPTRIEFDRT